MKRYRIVIEVLDASEDAFGKMQALAESITDATGLSTQLEVVEHRELYVQDKRAEEAATSEKGN